VVTPARPLIEVSSPVGGGGSNSLLLQFHGSLGSLNERREGRGRGFYIHGPSILQPTISVGLVGRSLRPPGSSVELAPIEKGEEEQCGVGATSSACEWCTEARAVIPPSLARGARCNTLIRQLKIT
jgi:hypothetical protein